MKISPSSRRLLPWIGAILLSVTVALGIIEATRLSLEHDYKDDLETEVTRRGFEVIAQTMNGNVMGAVSPLGLVDQLIKRSRAERFPWILRWSWKACRQSASPMRPTGFI